MALINSNAATVGLIEKYIGSAYDTVKNVSDNLDSLLQLSDDIGDFVSVYQGVHDTPPTTRENGDPLEEGDYYFDGNSNIMLVFSDNIWSPVGTPANNVEVIIIDSSHIIGSATIVKLNTPYIPDGSNVSVYVGGVFQFSTSTHPNGSYEETDGLTITFPTDALLIGEEVAVFIGSVVSNINPNISITKARYVTLSNNEQIITIPDGFVYSLGSNNLELFIDGLLAYVNIDYFETNPNVVTLVSSVLPAGTELIFKKGSIAGNVPPATADVVTLNIAADFFVNRDSQDLTKAILLKGRNTPADGGGGNFVYDPLLSKATANGGTVIDPQLNLANQGSNSGVGCWVRVYNREVKSVWFGNNIDDMRAFAGVSGRSNDLLTIRSFYSNSQKGGGTYYWDGFKSKSLHNGGTIISPTISTVPGSPTWWTAPTTGPDGCWIRVGSSPVSVMEFGAAGDGLTNDSGAFDKAKDYGPVEVPAGIYEVTSAIVGVFYSYGPTTIQTGSVTSITDLLV
jgi:hypothetical protein